MLAEKEDIVSLRKSFTSTFSLLNGVGRGDKWENKAAFVVHTPSTRDVGTIGKHCDGRAISSNVSPDRFGLALSST